jgi:hypothetical protein
VNKIFKTKYSGCCDYDGEEEEKVEIDETKLVIKTEKKVTIEGHTWSFIFVEGLKDQNVLGYCDKEKHKLIIEATLSESELYETVLHEALHIIEDPWPTDEDIHTVQSKRLYGALKALDIIK